MDEGRPEAFMHLFSVIEDNNLIRYSSVKRAVSTWIGIFDENSADRISEKLVEEHLHELQVRLEQKGYSVNLSADTAVQEKTADTRQSGSVLNHIFEHDESTSSIKRYSFDIRA